MQELVQYAATSNVPLIKSPSLRVPKPVEMPDDMYPLPPNINEYFAYPFALEQHILSVESNRQATQVTHTAHRIEYLRHREAEKTRRQREALRRVAPGFEPDRGILQPTRMSGATAPANVLASQSQLPLNPAPIVMQPRSVMDDLVDQLAALDSKRT